MLTVKKHAVFILGNWLVLRLKLRAWYSLWEILLLIDSFVSSYMHVVSVHLESFPLMGSTGWLDSNQLTSSERTGRDIISYHIHLQQSFSTLFSKMRCLELSSQFILVFLNAVFRFPCILETQSFVLKLWKFLAVSISADRNDTNQVNNFCPFS